MGKLNCIRKIKNAKLGLILLILTSLVFCNCNNQKKDTQDLKLEYILIDHKLSDIDNCNRTRIYFYFTLLNDTNDSLNINIGGKKFYCFWKYLKKDLFFKINKKEILSFGITQQFVIPPQQKRIIETCLIDLDFFSTKSLFEIEKELRDFLKITGYFEFENRKIKMNSEIKMIYKLDGKIIDKKDSLNYFKYTNFNEVPFLPVNSVSTD